MSALPMILVIMKSHVSLMAAKKWHRIFSTDDGSKDFKKAINRTQE